MYFLLEIQMYDQEVYEKCKFKKKKTFIINKIGKMAGYKINI